MYVLRGAKSIKGLPPNIYVNELAPPQQPDLSMDPFVLAFVGRFNRGPVNQFVHIKKTPLGTVVEAAESLFGKKTWKEPGNQLLDHLEYADPEEVFFVNIRGEGYATASIALEDRQQAAEVMAIITPKSGPGAYGNVCTAEVKTGSKPNTFTLILVTDLGATETYKDLSVDPNDERYFVHVIAESNSAFVIEHYQTSAQGDEALPAIIAQTQFVGGEDGIEPTTTNYIGTFDPGTGERSGLRLLEGDPASRITDLAFIDFSDTEADDALRIFGEKHNVMVYCGNKNERSIDKTNEYRETFDSDHVQILFGRYRSKRGQWASGASLSAIAHAIGNVEDSGIATEMTWLGGAEIPVDFDMATELFLQQVAAFQLKPSAKGDGSYAYRLSCDYTTAVRDEEGNVIYDDENRKVNRRRLNTWIEKMLYRVSAKYQGRAMTSKMKREAESEFRGVLDNLKEPINPLETSKLSEYSIRFDEHAQEIDQFVEWIKIKHYNTAEWILLNYQGGTNVEVDE